MKKTLNYIFMAFVLIFFTGTTYTTITIDGTNDFESDEDVAGTNSATYYITWDANNLYLGVQATDVASGSSTRWVLFYIDSDPQSTPTNGTGTTTGELYNTQQPSLPFTANYHFRWKANNTYTNLRSYNGSSWADGNQSNIAAFQNSTFVEFKIPLTNIGTPTQIYLVGAMINEQGGGEWTYHMTPSNNHTDGYDQNFVSRFSFDLTSGISPDNPAYVDAPLPVELSSFTYTNNFSSIKLDWQTSTELDNYGFHVERKMEKVKSDWKEIGFVEGSGTSNSPKNYSFVDEYPEEGLIKYRLKQIDFDGSFSYSNVLEINYGPVPQTSELIQNFPNPFNPSTVIGFRLLTGSHVQLKIFDMLGNEIKTLVNNHLEAGEHKVGFDGSNMPSGIYLYKIITPQFTQVKKMILAK